MQNGSDGLGIWPVWKQIANRDIEGLGPSACSPRSEGLAARTADADKVVGSVCPYCAVGCGQLVYVKDEKIIDIEGDPALSDIEWVSLPERRRHLPAGHGIAPVRHVLYRRPHGTAWEQIPLEKAMDMVAERVKATRDDHWEQQTRTATNCGARWRSRISAVRPSITKRTTSSRNCSLLGIVQIENQARI